jgi:antitoxin component YwqK of YwqJK toxin-antitoxin module
MVGMVARLRIVLSCPLLGLLGVVDTRRRRDWGSACRAASALVLSVAIFSACSRKELREEKYPNGALKSRGYVKQDAEKNYGRHGYWVFWYENGQKMQESIFRDGELEGPSTLWYENGQKKEESTFRNGKLKGPSTFWYENGRKEAEGEYRDAKQSGKRGDTGILKDGRHGYWVFWYANGQKKQESTFKDGKSEGPYAEWYENGHKKQESIFKDDKLEGPSTLWYENGQKMQESIFRDGELEGPSTLWYENGQKKQESNYRDGKLEGPATTWYESGHKKAEETYKDGKLEGHFIVWYENGQKKQESTLKDGKWEGPFTLWYENGQKEEDYLYKDGEFEGHEIMWYANGQKKFEETYKDGKLEGQAEWHENGRRAKAGTLTESESPTEPRVVTDNSDILSFGKPTVKPARYGITRVLVEAKNVTQHQVTCTLTATFLKGDSIIGTADGILSDVSAGDTKTAGFTTSDNVAGYDTLKLKTSSCF